MYRKLLMSLINDTHVKLLYDFSLETRIHSNYYSYTICALLLQTLMKYTYGHEKTQT